MKKFGDKLSVNEKKPLSVMYEPNLERLKYRPELILIILFNNR